MNMICRVFLVSVLLSAAAFSKADDENNRLERLVKGILQNHDAEQEYEELYNRRFDNVADAAQFAGNEEREFPLHENALDDRMLERSENGEYVDKRWSSSPTCSFCSCRCTSGYIRQASSPSANGCGTAGMPSGLNVFGFESCCNTHDRCYGRCGNSKSQCDSSFLSCMRSKCNYADPKDKCMSRANTYYWAVKLGGCGAYKDAQKAFCTCQ